MDLSSSLRHYAEELVSDDFEVENVTGFGSKVVHFSRHFLALAALLIFGLFLSLLSKPFFLQRMILLQRLPSLSP